MMSHKGRKLKLITGSGIELCLPALPLHARVALNLSRSITIYVTLPYFLPGSINTTGNEDWIAWLNIMTCQTQCTDKSLIVHTLNADILNASYKKCSTQHSITKLFSIQSSSNTIQIVHLDIIIIEHHYILLYSMCHRYPVVSKLCEMCGM